MTKTKINSCFGVAFIPLFVLLFTSCAEQPLYDEAYSFDNTNWSIEDTAKFAVEVEDTTKNYQFILTLRTKNTYKYSNLWVHIGVTAPDNTRSQVAQKINLARPDGSWIGRKTGTLVESKLHYQTTPFPLIGSYVFDITQATQYDKIGEIVDLSLRIVEVER